jgi:hypothetical protein
MGYPGRAVLVLYQWVAEALSTTAERRPGKRSSIDEYAAFLKILKYNKGKENYGQ